MLPPPGAPRDDIKRKFSFHLNPLPLASTPIGATWSSFFGYKNSRLERLIKREYLDEGWEGRYINNLKTVHNLKKMHCGRNGLLLLAKNALLEKGPTNSGIVRPPRPPPSANNHTHTLAKPPVRQLGVVFEATLRQIGACFGTTLWQLWDNSGTTDNFGTILRLCDSFGTSLRPLWMNAWFNEWMKLGNYIVTNWWSLVDYMQTNGPLLDQVANT